MITQAAIDAYLEKYELNLRPKSLKLYRTELQTLMRLHESPDILKAHLKKSAPSTAHRKLIIWQRFLLDQKMESFILSLKPPRLKKLEVVFLTESESETLLSYVNKVSLEAECFTRLGLEMGLRLSEILELNCLSVQEDWLLIKRKGGNIQRLPIPKTLKPKLKELSETTTKFFPHSTRYYQRKLKAWGKAAGLKSIHPHTLRHSFATRIAAEGHSLRSLQEFLGHSSITTTQKYLHVTPEHLQRLIYDR